jgi:hypothetical protein
MLDQDSGELVYHFEVSGELDRQTAEALRLEILRLAQRYGVDVSEFRVETPSEGSSG